MAINSPSKLYLDTIINKNNDLTLNNNGINSDHLNINGTNKMSNSNLIKYDSLRLCQITGLNEAKIYSFTNNQVDMIVNFDFFLLNGKKIYHIFFFFIFDNYQFNIKSIKIHYENGKI